MAKESKLEKATLGGGCFWCTEAIYNQVKGVVSVLPGYAGGQTPNPTYEAVCSGTTGHAEVIQVTYDPGVITYEEILEIFWAIHDPTLLNRQGPDTGTEYRSIILYHDEAQREITERSKAAANHKWWDGKIVTEIKKLETFYPAEEYHRDFYNKHPEMAYCQVIINPKLATFRAGFADKLK